jgi:hypothetical protein
MVAKVNFCFDYASFLQTSLIAPNMELQIKFTEYSLGTEALL